MKNQFSISRNEEFTFLEKVFLLLFSASLLCTITNGQQMPAGNKSISDKSINPDVEKVVRNTLKENCQKLQLIENNGQGSLPENVVAYFTSFNQTVFIEKDRLRIVVTETENKKIKKSKHSELTDDARKKNYNYSTFSIQFKNSKGFTSIEKAKPFETKRSFIYTSSNNKNNIAATSFSEIILKNIYTGIDLRLYSQSDGLLEFDWIVWPGANPNKIRLQFEGQNKMNITPTGSLEINLGLGKFYMGLPESYYVTPVGKKKVDVRFSINNKNEVYFKGFGRNIKKYPLVIDPDLLWGTFFDGGTSSFDEYLYGIEYNYNNNLIYCAGAANLQVSVVYAAALAVTYDGTIAGSTDALIYSLTKNGQLITHITYLGGTGADVATGISVSNSFVYICGYSASADFPVTKVTDGLFPAFDSTYHGSNEGFIAIMDLNLENLEYCSYLGGDGDDKALTVRAVGDSVFYISVSAKDTLPDTSPNYLVNYADNIFAGNSEAWIGKFSSFNNLDFGTYVGGNNDDLINDFQVLSTGDIVFTGNTKNITEVNASIPNNGSGQEALFGRINVPATGPVVFDIIDKIGGSNNDYGWGIYCLGDSVSIIVGQTNSSNFPLGTGTVFQNTRSGNYDGFIAKINNNGGPGYKATFAGGSDEDILVALRPVTVNHKVALLCWGTTISTDLATRNFNAGSFYSAVNAGTHDMMFVICDFDLVTKYYLSYIGGSAKDYLGATGAPVGANHLFYNAVDSALYLGTTTHSSETTHLPLFVGRGVADILNAGVPVFDNTKGNGINDTHVIIAISTASLYELLSIKWLSFTTKVNSDCKIQLSWSTADAENIYQFIVEKSFDGSNFNFVADIATSVNNLYTYTDNGQMHGQKVYYRIKAKEINGLELYSAVKIVQPCIMENNFVKIYPTIISNAFTISGLDALSTGRIIIELTDAMGKKVLKEEIAPNVGSQTFNLKSKPAAGVYFITLKSRNAEEVILFKKVLIK